MDVIAGFIPEGLSLTLCPWQVLHSKLLKNNFCGFLPIASMYCS